MDPNAHQVAAILAPEPRVVLRAGAGSGKTETLTRRTVREAERPHGAVRLFAFTRAAAAELRARLAVAAPDLVDRVTIATIHAHAAEVCRRHLPRLDRQAFGRGWSILGQADDEQIRVEAATRQQDPEQLRRANGLVTYHELLTLGLRCLRELPEAAAERGGSVLVDEAQDLVGLEWEWLAALRPDRLTAVGDPAQAIYGWRGAQSDVLVGPGSATHPAAAGLLAGARWLDLPTNYRSRAEILDRANRLAIPGRVTLEAVRGPGGAVELLHVPDDAALLAGLPDLLGWGAGSWAILSRTRARLQPVYDRLTAAGIPVHAPVLEGRIWEEQAAARELVDLLQVAHNPHDSLHLARCLLRAGWSKAQLLAAEAGRCGLEACSLWNWVCAPVPGRLALGSLAHRLVVALAELPRGDARAAAESLRRAGVARPETPVAAVPEDLSVPEFLHWLADPADREQAVAPEGAVTLATLHGAKGREWPSVLVLGWEEGHFPSGRGELAEERRLAYVAVTRARDRLVLAHADFRPGWRGRGCIPCEPSRFLAELGLL